MLYGLFFAVSIFSDFRLVANSAKIKPMQKIPDIRYAPGVKMKDLDFCHILTLLPLGASVFHKHMSSCVTCEALWHIGITLSSVRLPVQ